jgi:hypothetical protein
MASPSELQDFVRKIRHLGPEKLQNALRDSLARGDMKLQDQNGNILSPEVLNLDSFRAEIPEDFNEFSEVNIYVENNNGEPVQAGIERAEVVVPEDRVPTGPPGVRGYLWRGTAPPNPRKCPRCGETMIPTNERPGEYQGAMSRIRVGGARPGYASRSVEICSPCGTDEAMGRGQVPIEQWPIGLDPTAGFYDTKRNEEIDAVNKRFETERLEALAMIEDEQREAQP